MVLSRAKGFLGRHALKEGGVEKAGMEDYQADDDDEDVCDELARFVEGDSNFTNAFFSTRKPLQGLMDQGSKDPPADMVC